MQIIDSAILPRAPFAEFEGCRFGTSVSLIFVTLDEMGLEPDLHQHPYPETFVIRAGQARFTVGSQQMVGAAGQIIVVPTYTPHTFQFIGPTRLDMIDIHAHDTFVTQWLVGPRAKR